MLVFWQQIFNLLFLIIYYVYNTYKAKIYLLESMKWKSEVYKIMEKKYLRSKFYVYFWRINFSLFLLTFRFFHKMHLKVLNVEWDRIINSFCTERYFISVMSTALFLHYYYYGIIGDALLKLHRVLAAVWISDFDGFGVSNRWSTITCF